MDYTGGGRKSQPRQFKNCRGLTFLFVVVHQLKGPNGLAGITDVGPLLKHRAAELTAVAGFLLPGSGRILRRLSGRGLFRRGPGQLGQQGHEAALVIALNGGHLLEHDGDILQPLGPGLGGEIGVHVVPLAVLPHGGLGQALLGVGGLSVEQLEPEPGVHHLILGHLFKGGGHLLVPVGPGGHGKVGVLVAGNRLPSQGLAEIFRGLCSFDVHVCVLLFNLRIDEINKV